MFIFFVQFIDHLILIGNFIIQTANCMVLICLLLFNLLNSHINIINVFLNRNTFLFQDFFVSSCKLSFQINNLRRGLSLLLMVNREISLFLFKCSQKLLLLSFNSHILFQKPCLCFKLLIVFSPNCICLFLKDPKLFLRIWHSNKRSSLLN